MSEATKQLEALLSDAESLIALLLETHIALLPKELHPPLRHAWPDARKRFASVRAILANPSSTLEADLISVGLTGPDLDLKLAGYNRARAQLDTASRSRKAPRGLGWLFRRVLAWLNTILGSLATVLPGADAIREFKEAIENGIEDNAPPV